MSDSGGAKRGPGRPRKFEVLPEGALPAREFDLRAAMLAGIDEAFPGTEVSLKELDESDPKLASRHLMAQLRVRVLLPKFALATLIPVDGDEDDVAAALTRLKQDRRRNEDFLKSLPPEPQSAPGTRD